MTRLSDLLTELNSETWSSRRVAHEAEKLGFNLSHDTANKYLRGRHGVPEEETLEAFAAVFRADVGRLRRAAGLASGELGPYKPPAEASRLGQRERDLVDELIRMLAVHSARAELANFASELIATDQHTADLWLRSPAFDGYQAVEVKVSGAELTRSGGRIELSWPAGSGIKGVQRVDTLAGPAFFLVTTDGRRLEMEVLDPEWDEPWAEGSTSAMTEWMDNATQAGGQLARFVAREGGPLSEQRDASDDAVAAHDEEVPIADNDADDNGRYAEEQAAARRDATGKRSRGQRTRNDVDTVGEESQE
jgi:transcriptional regulator with XRE-family HTH domain